MPKNATTLPLKRQMKRRKFLYKIASYGERLQTDNLVLIWQLGYLESAASTVCNDGDI
ncbi:hypothetical protein [Nostoc sp. CHAB 5715]|uniref:hypothetical protein n=1 Tax=Nostoc sp. CHAB 5715 TaxID=2780400 RepID=UPI001E300361|nr:hypothetical protein [Nostoc sp. CHAB 5715]MCC5624168.1 hypothetical protein [Nostoc sp. CHAB 5715]